MPNIAQWDPRMSAGWLLELVNLAASRDGLDDGNHDSGAHGAHLLEAIHLRIEVNPRCSLANK